MESAPLRVVANLTNDDYIAVLTHTYERVWELRSTSRRQRGNMLSTVVVACVMSVGALVALATHLGQPSRSIIVTLVLLGTLVTFLLLAAAALRPALGGHALWVQNCVARYRDMIANREIVPEIGAYVFSIEPEYFVVENARGTSRRRWAGGITRIDDLPNLIAVELSPTVAIPVPKRCFESPQAAERFVAAARARLEAAGADNVSRVRNYVATRDIRCPECRHNLRGSSGDGCPECGTTISFDRILRWKDTEEYRDSPWYSGDSPGQPIGGS